MDAVFFQDIVITYYWKYSGENEVKDGKDGLDDKLKD